MSVSFVIAPELFVVRNQLPSSVIALVACAFLSHLRNVIIAYCAAVSCHLKLIVELEHNYFQSGEHVFVHQVCFETLNHI